MRKLAIAFSLLASPALATGLQINIEGEANGTVTIVPPDEVLGEEAQ